MAEKNYINHRDRRLRERVQSLEAENSTFRERINQLLAEREKLVAEISMLRENIRALDGDY